MSIGTLTNEGSDLVRDYFDAIQHMNRAQSELNRAYDNVGYAGDKLAKWILPEDAKRGERIAVWYGDSLIQVEVGGTVSEVDKDTFETKTRNIPHKITVRTRGRKSGI